MLGKARTLALVAIVACSTASGQELPLQMPAAAPENPSGAAYPSDHVGTRQRQNTSAGDRIANLSFRGYRGGVAQAELQTLSLADYYDPDATRHRALYVFAAASWCAICKRVATELERRGTELEARGVRILVVLVNGREPSQGPSLDDLDAFAALHPMKLDLGVDVRATALGAYGLQGVPFNMLIDTRSMEILDESVGEPDLDRYVAAGLDYVEKNPPAYR